MPAPTIMGEGLTTGSASPAFIQTPYREPRLGSGVRCPATLDEEGTRCESPLTSRMRAGVDTLDRPIGEYLCETCGTIFVAISVSLDPRLRFADIVVDSDYDMSERTPVPLYRALRRIEREPEQRGVNHGEQRARIEDCPECGALVRTDTGEWQAHALSHGEDL